MKFLAIAILILVASCSEYSVRYSNINHSLIVTSKSDVVCNKVEFEYYDESALKHKSFNIIAISKTFNKVFRREDLIAKAKELNACKIVETTTTTCASRTVFDDFAGCWNYDLIYFVK